MEAPKARPIRTSLLLLGLACALPLALTTSAMVFPAWADETPPASTTDASAADSSTAPAPTAPAPSELASAAPELLPDLLKQLPPREARAAGFQGLTPGRSRAADVLAKLGEPKEKVANNNITTWTYSIGPFPSVAMSLSDQQLISIRAQFAESRPVEEILKELGLAKFAAAAEFGLERDIVTLLYPERGLRIELNPADARQGIGISLHIPTADDFVWRAERDQSSQYQQQLADLRQALSMDSGHERALALELRIYDEAGIPDLALARAESAQQQHPQSLLVRLELARQQIRHRRYEAARAHLSHILAESPAESLLACRARLFVVELDAASLLGAPEDDDSRRLVSELVQVIQTSAAWVKDKSFSNRADAREIILLAHLSAARIISDSNWESRGETVTKWLVKAESIAQSHIREDHAPPTTMLLVWQTGLECHSQLEGQLDPLPVLEQMTQRIDALLVSHKDPLFQRCVRARYATALLAAARTLQLRGDLQHSSIFARRTAEVADAIAHSQPPHRECELLLGQALFNIGAVYGVGRNDHENALLWYDRAEPLLDAPIPEWCAHHRASVGDQLVSIGLSNWEVGQRQRGIELTEKGLAQLQAAMHVGGAQKPAAAVAFSNLAFMHSAVGNRDKAREFTELARKLNE